MTTFARCITDLMHDPSPEGTPFQFEVTLVAQATPVHPPLVRVTVRNTSEASQTLRAMQDPLPFAPTFGLGPDETKLVVQDVRGHHQPKDGCWQADALYRHDSDDRHEFSPERELQCTLGIFSHARNDECWPPWEYRFLNDYEYLNTDIDNVAFVWGFLLTVE